MRLLQFYLEEYRVLRQLSLRFGEVSQDDATTYALNFLVGVNGSGKSTVLKALVDILRKLEQNAPLSTLFRLEYTLGLGNEQKHIILENQPVENERPALSVFENEHETKFSASYHLPRRIVIFTTGSEEEWEEQTARSTNTSEDVGITSVEQLHLISTQLAIQELPGRPLISLEEAQNTSEATEAVTIHDNRFLLIRSAHLPILTLCGLLTHLASETRLLTDVLTEMKIQYVRGFSLKFRMNRGTTPDDAPEREEIRRLRNVATRALQMGTDYTLFFDLMNNDDTEQGRLRARKILQVISGASNIPEAAQGLYLFELLTQLADTGGSVPPILREVNLFLEHTPDQDRTTRTVMERSPLLLLDWLSDGERSFLGRMCLFMLLGGTESLILLDEPEVHFNDYWKRQIVYLIDKVLQGQPSHALVTTHSSITLTDAPSNHIVVLDRTGIYTSDSFRPGIRTYAADPSDIIVSVFGAPQATGAQSVNRVLETLKIRDEERRRNELKRLLDIVGPGYWRYRIRRELLALGE